MTFNDPVSALTYLNDHEVAIVLADLSMPSMSGAKFFYEAKYVQPSAIRVALSGNAEQNDLIEVINKGDISYVLSKPWGNEELTKTLFRFKSQFEKTGGAEKYAKRQEAINAKLSQEKESLASQLDEKIKYIDLLDLKCKAANKRYNGFMQDTLSLMINIISDNSHIQKPDLVRMASHAKELAGYISSTDESNDKVYTAALLHPMGLISDEKNKPPSSAYQAYHLGCCHFGDKAAELLAQNSSFEFLLLGIKYQDENFDGTVF